MPRRSPAKDAPVDFDELISKEEPSTPAAEVEEEEPASDDKPQEQLTPAQRRLIAAREAAAALDAAAAPEPEANEDPFEGLTEDQIAELKALEDRVVQANTRKLSTAELTYDGPTNSRKGGTGEVILFHVREDGFNAFGNIWYRGQEFEVEVGTPAYLSTVDKNGFSWLSIVGDEHAQYAKWGRHRLGAGEFRPLPGEKFDDELVSEDRRRKRMVPTIATV